MARGAVDHVPYFAGFGAEFPDQGRAGAADGL